MTYTLGMTGPINVADFRDFIDPAQWRDDLPKGQGGTPVNLLCRELLKRGRKLVVFSCDSAVREEIVLEGEHLRLCLGPKGVRPARNFFRTEREYLAKAIAREKPDLIHAQWTYEYAMPVQISGIPHLVTAHDTPLSCLYHNFIPYRIARTLMAYRVINRARRIVSVSPYVDEHLRRYVLYRGGKEIIPNGLPEDAFEHYRLRADRKVGPVTFVSILVGWVGYKNAQAAIRAFAEVRKTCPDARYLMFGADHGPGEKAEVWARTQGLADGIEFVGHMPYPELMQRLVTEADVLVHPALVEAFGLVIIEAMVRKIPVIAGQQSGAVPWTVDHGNAGLLVDVTSPSAIAEAMLKLAHDHDLRQRYGELGHDSIRRRFHIEAVADAHEKIYAQIMEQQ